MDRTGPVHVLILNEWTGPDRTDRLRKMMDRTGPIFGPFKMCGPDRTGPVWTGPDRSGPDRTDFEWTDSGPIIDRYLLYYAAHLYLHKFGRIR